MSKATPGPWIVWWNGRTIIPADHADRRNGASEDDVKDRDDYAQIIAIVCEDRHKRGDTKANARLLAASWSMLEALKAMMEGNKPPSGAGSGKVWDVKCVPSDQACTMAAAAITYVEGMET